MSVTAEVASTPGANAKMEKNAEFSHERLKAPFFLRCGALIIDYIFVMAMPLIWLVSSKMMSDTPSTVTMTNTGWELAIFITFVDLLVLPVIWGKSLGKMLTGLTIVKKDGSSAGIGRVLLRNTIGYLLTVATLGLGFLISAVNVSGRSLHDFVAGTIVVGGKKKLV